jgi:outer membrane lipoprotein SlyB
MRNKLFLLCVLGVSCVSGAQSNQASWANLNRLQPGQQIQIVEMNVKKLSGAFVNVSDSAITLKDSVGEQSVPMQDVRSVKRAKSNHRLRNTLIGAGVGASAGAGITAAAWDPDGFFGKGVGAAVGAVIGGVAGAIVGVLLPSHDTVYKAPSH